MRIKSSILKMINDKSGGLSSRDVLIIAIVLLVGLVVIFIVAGSLLQKRASGPELSAEYLEQIKNIAPGPESGQSDQKTGIAFQTHQGIVTRISGNEITINESQTQQTLRFLMTSSTLIYYQGESYSRTRLNPGDHLNITYYVENGVWLASEITVRIATSPETAAPVPALGGGTIQIGPDGAMRPFGTLDD